MTSRIIVLAGLLLFMVRLVLTHSPETLAQLVLSSAGIAGTILCLALEVLSRGRE